MRLTTLIHLGLIWLTLGTAAEARAAPPPAELFFKDPDIVEAVLSPDGTRLALTSALHASRVGLLVIDLARGAKLGQAVRFGDGDVRHVAWVNEDRLVFSIEDRAEGSGRPNGRPGLFAVNADGSELRGLIRREPRPLYTGGRDMDRALDLNHYLVQVPTPQAGQPNDEVLVAEVVPGSREGQILKWLDTRTAASRSVDLQAPPHVVRWMTDSRGQPRVAFTRDGQRQAAWWRGPGQTDWVSLYDTELMRQPFVVHDVDDAGGLYVTQTVGEQRLEMLTRYDFERRAPAASPWVVTPGFDFDGAVMTRSGTAGAVAVRVHTDAETTVWMDPAMQAFQRRVDEQFPGHVNRISCRRCGSVDMVALVLSYSDHDPGSYWVYRTSPGASEATWVALGEVRSGVLPEQMASVHLERIRARDGRDLPVWVTRPDGVQGPLPAVVLVHGGPWTRAGYWRWSGFAQFLASRGYVVIAPDMRGSTGYGLAHYQAGLRQFGQAMQDDVADALRWAQRQGLASDRACIAGGSYGGYSTLMGLARDPELYRCGVAWVALTDLRLYVAGDWWVIDDIGSPFRQFTAAQLVGDPEKDASMIEANSPVHLAARMRAPLLLAYGEADKRVPIAHGQRMRQALIEAGHPPEWVSYRGEGHDFALLKNRVDLAQRMEAFLGRYLGPEPAPAP